MEVGAGRKPGGLSGLEMLDPGLVTSGITLALALLLCAFPFAFPGYSSGALSA